MDVKYYIYVLIVVYSYMSLHWIDQLVVVNMSVQSRQITEREKLDQNDNEKKLDSLVEAGNLSEDQGRTLTVYADIYLNKQWSMKPLFIHK